MERPPLKKGPRSRSVAPLLQPVFGAEACKQTAVAATFKLPVAGVYWRVEAACYFVAEAVRQPGRIVVQTVLPLCVCVAVSLTCVHVEHL